MLLLDDAGIEEIPGRWARWGRIMEYAIKQIAPDVWRVDIPQWRQGLPA
jgi:hypothetical protein